MRIYFIQVPDGVSVRRLLLVWDDDTTGQIDAVFCHKCSRGDLGVYSRSTPAGIILTTCRSDSASAAIYDGLGF